MGDAYIAVIPDCPTHGTMHRVQAKRALGNGWYVLEAAYWVCHGFDGEGCDHVVDDKDLDWHPMGEAEFNWTWAPDREVIIQRQVLP